MKLTLNVGLDRFFVWYVFDYVDELLKLEQFVIRFKIFEEVVLFKCKFEEVQNILKVLGINIFIVLNYIFRIVKEFVIQDNKDICKVDGGNLNFEFQIVKKEGFYWNCNSCFFKNVVIVKKCVLCQNINLISNKEFLGFLLVENGFVFKIGLENV